MKLPDENEFFRQATLRISSSLNSETAMRRCMGLLETLHSDFRDVLRLLRSEPERGGAPAGSHLALEHSQTGWNNRNSQSLLGMDVKAVGQKGGDPDHQRHR